MRNSNLLLERSRLLATAVLAIAAALHLQAHAADADASRPAPVVGSIVQPVDARLNPTRASDAGAADIDAGKTGGARPASALPVMNLGKDYRIGPNDLIDVEVLDVDNLKRTVRVNAAGAVSLPLIGQVMIGGLTPQEAEQRIADRYREKYLQNPQVTLFIKEFTTERITIEGAVARPGIFPLTGQITLLRALAMAGGFGPIANSSEVMLFRINEQRQKEVKVYDVEQIRAGKSDDPMIKGDDLIVVQRDSTRRILKDSIIRDVFDTINPFSVFTR